MALVHLYRPMVQDLFHMGALVHKHGPNLTARHNRNRQVCPIPLHRMGHIYLRHGERHANKSTVVQSE